MRRAAALMFVLVAMALLVASAAAAPPEIKIKAPEQVEATEPGGAVVSYQVEVAVEEGEEPPVPTCSPESGSFFAIGNTTITCTTDTASASKTVTVADTTPPAISAPSGISDSTTDPNGKAVSFDVSATDLGQAVAVSCTPASGSTFAIGTTPVQCTANDGRGNTATAGFNVVLTLLDTVPPTFTATPGDITREATGPTTPVSWTIAATDNSGSSPTINCTPPSGSGFGVGTTPVACTATDAGGNSANHSFNVIVADTTPPSLSLPSNQTAETENPGGTSVTYSAGASDTVAGTISPSCSPASGANFPIGATTVNCTAADGSGNSASGSFTVTVVLVDRTAPVLSGLANRSVEANGPSGSTVSFPTPTATDALDGPIPGVACSKPSGSLFPVGPTVVTCSATDAHGNTGVGSFTVFVNDTTPPALYAPADRSVTATEQGGIPASAPNVSAFLASAIALDIVDPSPVVIHNAPAFFPLGLTVVTFEARDAGGNRSTKDVRVTVLPFGSPPVATPPPPRPLGEVTNLSATPGDRLVRLAWRKPTAGARVAVTRTPAGGTPAAVYTGTASSYVDRGLLNGTEYRYVVKTVDADGNASAGVAVTAVPRRNLLRSPKDGARLRKPPKLIWAPQAEADYYNVQLRRNGVKILSAWPVRATLQLGKSWRFEGKRYALAPGLYVWHVWPGYGPRASVDYGTLLGARSFRIVR